MDLDVTLDGTGVITDRRPVVRNRVLNAFSIGLPLAGAASALAVPESLFPTWTTACVFALFFAAEAIGVGIGLHRYYTHKAFRTGPALQSALAIFGTWAMQGPVDRWVADHRRHHRYTDQALDPHSPHWTRGERERSRMRGLLWSHLTNGYSDPRR